MSPLVVPWLAAVGTGLLLIGSAAYTLTDLWPYKAEWALFKDRWRYDNIHAPRKVSMTGIGGFIGAVLKVADWMWEYSHTLDESEPKQAPRIRRFIIMGGVWTVLMLGAVVAFVGSVIQLILDYSR